MEHKSASSLSKEPKDDTATSVFHIYHTGSDKKHPGSYAIHSVPDSETTIFSKTESVSSTINSKAALEKNQSAETTTPKPLRGAKRARVLDNPEYDPRSETAPYFVHLPSLFGHCPPYTLRYGGHKRAPVSCLLHPSWGWRGWTLQFGDILAQEGVIDPRGVVNAEYGTKDGKDGFLKGYKVRKRRYWGESGKAWWMEQKEKGFPEAKDSKEVKIKPEEIVSLRWTSPFSRHTRKHSFSWRGSDFEWKGTRQIESKKGARPFVFCNHLKLVVLVPEASSSQEKDAKKIELCLARYACVIGKRKAGRLEVYQDVIDTFLANHVLHDGSDNETKKSPDELLSDSDSKAKTQKRIRDVVVGTCIGMIQSEREKRRFLLELLQAAGEAAGS